MELVRQLGVLSAVAWGWAVAVALDDLRATPSLDDVEPAPPGTAVSVVVPARNEEGRLAPALRSLLAQTQSPLEIVVVDDESTDGTRAEARAFERDGIRVVAGAPLPAGWVGKSWANHQGAALATGEWLLFTDADIIHAPEALARALALATELGRGGLTIICRLSCETASERIVQPAAAVLIRSFVAPGPLVRSPRFGIAIAAGGFILLERALYDRVGGHEAVRERLVDDQALAQLVKRSGGLLVVAEGERYVHVRMYHGLREIWRGWRKNSSLGIAQGSVAPAVAGAVQAALISAGPALALAGGHRRLGSLGLALQIGARIAVHPVAPTPVRYWATLPLGTLFLAAVSLLSSADRLRGGLEWRGRVYRPAAKCEGV